MSVRVRIPSPLQALTNNLPEVVAEGATLREALADLEARFRGMRTRLYDEEGKLRRFVNVYVNDEDIRFLQGEDTALKEGDEVSIIPAIAGGAPSPSVGGVRSLAHRAVKLTFPQELITEPVTFRMAKRFDVMPNIRRARVTETIGELVLELEGTEENLEQAIQYLREQGVQVAAVEGDILE